jgi:hypothetical protein
MGIISNWNPCQEQAYSKQTASFEIKSQLIFEKSKQLFSPCLLKHFFLILQLKLCPNYKEY